jgi:signal transduction histidine kinase
MASVHAIRVRVAAPPTAARRLCARLTRGGIPAAPDDGASRSEILVVVAPAGLAPYRPRAAHLVVVGAPGAPYFAAGADEVVVPHEPEILFRRLRSLIERVDLMSRLERLTERVAALEAGLADAAHDVRSPLQSVIGNAELLAGDSSLSPKQREIAAAAARQAQRAVQLAERILESARRPQRTPLDVRALDLGGLVESAVSQARPQAKQRGVTLAATPPVRPVELRADAHLLTRLLDNLIANAVRATPRGGMVEVSGWRASPKLIRIAVKDAGAGIPAAELPKLVAGLGPGRGLRIARDVAERHGGDLWAESSSGGTRFFVELPLSPPSSRPRLLLVSDDNRGKREVSRTLKTAYEVRGASVATARLGNRRTDLVLVDPGKRNGKKLQALRIEAKGAQVPLIELPSEMTAARLARTLAHLSP